MGFEVYERQNRELELLQLPLNTQKDHPAPYYADTFYLSPSSYCVRTSTRRQVPCNGSKGKTSDPRLFPPGKVFRSDDDATHSPMFSQMEGLVVVNEGITLCDLREY